jgi:hypothetical protein
MEDFNRCRVIWDRYVSYVVERRRSSFLKEKGVSLRAVFFAKIKAKRVLGNMEY